MPARPYCRPLLDPADSSGSSAQVLEQFWQMPVREPGPARDAALLLPGLGLGLGCDATDLG